MGRLDWSPDGTEIAYLSHDNMPEHEPESIFAVNVQTGAQRPLLGPVSGMGARCTYQPDFAWSPDGSRIAYGGLVGDVDSPGGCAFNVMTMSSNGQDAAAALGPVISANGQPGFSVGLLPWRPVPLSVTVNDGTLGSSYGFQYSGTWKTATGGGRYMADDNYSAWTGSSYTFKFSGTRLALYGAKAPHHGQATIQIDGGTAQTFDEYAASRQDNALVWSRARWRPATIRPR
jgi:hypothetical protein